MSAEAVTTEAVYRYVFVTTTDVNSVKAELGMFEAADGYFDDATGAVRGIDPFRDDNIRGLSSFTDISSSIKTHVTSEEAVRNQLASNRRGWFYPACQDTETQGLAFLEDLRNTFGQQQANLLGLPSHIAQTRMVYSLAPGVDLNAGAGHPASWHLVNDGGYNQQRLSHEKERRGSHGKEEAIQHHHTKFSVHLKPVIIFSLTYNPSCFSFLS